MEMEVDTNAVPEESIFDIPGDNDGSNLENERCGICMDVIIDRGVLDCCQHWFCFACIDNWATITNLCPLCQNEFQLITCVPVYDTIGSSKVEDDSFVRDDDWFIQEKNNTLSFPSYYIDENAVICLDGDGCKIRNGMASTMENTNLDTSIACDSCDIWYHAFCVGFDPESTSESSWLCPRCVIDDLPQKSDHGAPMQILNNQHAPETASCECAVESSFSGKLSVSVADAGETAVVVSIIEGQEWNDEHTGNFLSVLHNNEEKTETFLTCTSGNSSLIETQMNKNIDSQSNLDSQDTSLTLSLSRDMHSLPRNSLPVELKTTSSSKAISDPSGPDGCKLSSSLVSVKANTESGAPDSESKVDLQLGLSVGSSLSGLVNNEATENHLSAVLECIEDSSSVDKMAANASEDAPGVIGVKRKSTSPRVPPGDQILLNDSNENDNIQTGAKMVAPTKKARLDGNSQPSTLNCEIKSSSSVGTTDDKFGNVPENEDDSSDIMSIVRGTHQRPTNGLSRPKTPDKSSQEKDNGIGLRVKKILRRAAEDDSSKLLEKLREEIKEAVRNKSTKDITKSNLFDPKLLAAFRAVIAGPQTEQAPVKRSNPLVVKTKKSLLQKGKIRENLTKKIYGTANGRRRRAWDRDWEVEFWKHRCNGSARPEKVETLKSVLDLLRKNSESSEMEKETEKDGGNAILSRLYLADTSVFPRKVDIKPLSALSDQNNHEAVVKDHNLNDKVSKSVINKCTSQIPAKSSKSSSQACTSSFDKQRKGDASNSKDEAASKKINSSGSTGKKSSASMPNGSKGNTQSIKEMPGKSDVKTDKRKWALEILARKNATATTNATQDKQGDNAMLKGNFPLLAQLPEDMRPVLTSSRRNKVPISVRQAQLYRLAEHFLRKTNLPVIRRTADTELAVADATNIEKEIADKSNSKLVYVNLCSRVLSQDANNNSNKPRSDDLESNQSASATKEPCSNLSAEEALRMAGLADSPPSSPCHTAKRLNDDDDDDDEPSKMARDEGLENVFDMDTHHPDLDIYGDFEYDLDDDCINDTVLEVPKSQPEETDTRMKVVFSTLIYDKTNDEPTDSKDLEGLQNAEVPTQPQRLEFLKDKTLELRADASSPSAEPLQGEIGELSLAECEELYGPDKEPLASRFPDKTSREANLFENGAHEENLNHSSNNNALAIEMEGESCAENIFVSSRLPADQNSSGGETSPDHSLTNKNVQSKEKKTSNGKQSDICHSISKKVEVYIKEHIRPLCKSGVITSEQYRWAVGKTTEKVMRFHAKDKNANFLIKEGKKVKKLAEQYVEAAQQKQGKISRP